MSPHTQTSTAASSTAARAPSPAPGTPVAPAVAGPYGVSGELLARAFEAGVVAGRKLRGEIPRVFPIGRLEGLPATKFYIVLSGRMVGRLAPPCLFNSWRRAYAHVCDTTEDGLLDAAVFHRFPSLTESLEYCRGSQAPLPLRIFGHG